MTVTRRVSVRGAIMIGGQRIHVCLPHAGKTAEVTVEPDTYQIHVEDGAAITAARKTSRDVKRHKASNYGHDQRPTVSQQLRLPHGRLSARLRPPPTAPPGSFPPPSRPAAPPGGAADRLAGPTPGHAT